MVAPTRSALHLVLATIAVTGCECGDHSLLGKVSPKIDVSPTSIMFGDVPLGARKHARVAVKNSGSSTLMLGALDIMSPFTATPSTQVIMPGSTAGIDVVFTPPGGEAMSGQTSIPFMGTLNIHSDDTATPTVVVMLSGNEVHGTVSVRPTMIDLSNTPLGTTPRIPIFIANNGMVDVSGSVTTTDFPRPDDFTLSTLANFAGSGPIAIQSDANAEFDLDYHPIQLGADNGRIIFQVCGDDCGIEVAVTASAVQAVVELDPPFIDFGMVGIGQTASKPVTVKNTGNMRDHITAVSTNGGPDLTAAPAGSIPAAIDPNSSMAINLDFKPSSAATLQGQLIVRTDDPGVPVAFVRVTGSGQGPLFVVQPSAIDFGVVRGMSTTRRGFLLLNSGSADVRVTSINVTGAPFALSNLPGFPARIGSGETLTAYATFTPTSMGAFMGSITIATDDPSNPMVTIPLVGGMANRLCQLDAANTTIDFGLLPFGSTRTRSVIVTNVGTDACHIISGDFRAPVDPAFSFGMISWPMALMPNDHFTIAFTYAPTMRMPSSDNFVMTTDDPVFPERHILLEGSAMDYADVFVQPNSIDFGSSKPMCSAGSRGVTIFNAGTVDAYVDNIQLVDSTTEFTFSTPLSTPATVPHGGSSSFAVSYTPVDVGTDVNLIEIAVRDHPYPIAVPIQGAGTSNPRITDQFQQNAVAKVDVLFIMGNTLAPADLQPGLAMNVHSFIAATSVRQVDFHIGVTSTNINPVAGLLLGPVLTSQSAAIDSAFAMEVQTMSQGPSDDDEQSLKAMEGAFALAAAGTAPNNSLFRPDARVVVIIITDDDDTSPDTPLYYYNVLRNHAPQGFVVAVVSGGTTGCGDADTGTAVGGAEAAPRLMAFLQLTQGKDVSECAQWGASLSQLGMLAFGLPNRFILSKPADPSQTINVSVNGMPAPPGSWMYDAMSGSIVFASPPPPGSSISIDYTPAC
jgi:hypothetical protein